jgi:hypothetical protein
MPRAAPKGRRCTIFQHPQRPNIDLAIATGISRRLIAVRFKVSADAAWRHGRAHLTPEIRAALATKAISACRPPAPSNPSITAIDEFAPTSHQLTTETQRRQNVVSFALELSARRCRRRCPSAGARPTRCGDHVDDAGMKSIGDALGTGEIGRDGRRHEAVLCRGSERDRLLVGDRRDGDEDFFIKGRRSGCLSVGESATMSKAGGYVDRPLSCLHRDTRTGTGICVSRVRVTPPKMISAHRAWL